MDDLVGERVGKDEMDYRIDERLVEVDWKDSAATKVVEDKGFHLKLSCAPKIGQIRTIFIRFGFTALSKC